MEFIELIQELQKLELQKNIFIKVININFLKLLQRQMETMLLVRKMELLDFTIINLITKQKQ